jgi:hypothetical protein
MDERSYARVANTLNKFGVWTSWCSQFLTEAGFKTLGMAHLERSLRSAGWRGGTLELHVDVDPGGGFGYGNVLLDGTMIGDNAKPQHWLRFVRDHAEVHHRSYLVEGKRSFCVTPAAAL